MADQLRGVCPVCSQEFMLRKDGTLRLHSSPFGTDYGPKPNCRGAGQQPVSEGA